MSCTPPTDPDPLQLGFRIRRAGLRALALGVPLAWSALGCASAMDLFRGERSSASSSAQESSWRDETVETSPGEGPSHDPSTGAASGGTSPTAAASAAPVDPRVPAERVQGKPEPAAKPDKPSAKQAAAAEKAASPLPGALRIDLGPDSVPVLVPRNEELQFDVTLNLGWLGDPTVGRVSMLSRVEPYHATPLVKDAPKGPEKETGVLRMHAEGSYTVYDLDETITSTILPQEWPNTIYRTVQTGSECRQRELMFGTKDGEPRARYRSDRHCKGCDNRAHFVAPNWAWQKEHHCEKCKRAEHRVWRDPEERPIPPHTLDMLSAVYLARSMLVYGKDRAQFKLLDQVELWDVELQRGNLSVIEVPAGRFRAVEVRLNTRVPKGEKARKAGDFEGLFGIHGTISIFMNPESGVPVLIRGQVPAGPMDLDVSIGLESFTGTPESFVELR
jgi:uncharacterized protein DUF3108